MRLLAALVVFPIISGVANAENVRWMPALGGHVENSEIQRVAFPDDKVICYILGPKNYRVTGFPTQFDANGVGSISCVYVTPAPIQQGPAVVAPAAKSEADEAQSVQGAEKKKRR
jgi:hypothetical protein